MTKLRHFSRPFFTLFLATLTSGLICATVAAADGFVPLFNGQNLDGWNPKIKSGDEALARKVFTVHDGVIHAFNAFPDNYELDTGKNDTHGMIYTVKSYDRFIFRFEYKWGTKRVNNFGTFQYDAGCYYHVTNDKIWPVGLEYQVRYNHLAHQNHTGDFWSPPNTEIHWYSGEGKTFLAPSRGGMLQPVQKGEHRASPDAPYHAIDDQWNQCEVIVMGSEYAIHKLNGVIVNLATDLNPGAGLIGLQAETAEIFYRHIEIKEFAKSVPLETFLK